jgi:hypothetical protein
VARLVPERQPFGVLDQDGAAQVGHRHGRVARAEPRHHGHPAGLVGRQHLGAAPAAGGLVAGRAHQS